MEQDGFTACRISRGAWTRLESSPCWTVAHENEEQAGHGDNDPEADRQLRERINAHALTLPLPPAAVVTDSCFQGDQVCEDLLSVVTVLAKSSGHVYLRDKQPNLAAIQPGRRVVVLIPPPGSLP